MKAGIALVALCAMSAFGYTPETHNHTYTTNGVTYAQRGGLGASDYVVTNIDAEAVGKVKSVNGKDGEVVLDYADVGAMPDTFEEQDPNATAKANAAIAAAGCVRTNDQGVALLPGVSVGRAQYAEEAGNSQFSYSASEAVKSSFSESLGNDSESFNYDTAMGWFGSLFEEVQTSIPKKIEAATNGLAKTTVPVTRKINGVPLTQDITIQGMPTTGLVWSATAVKTADGAKTIGAADVGALDMLDRFSFNSGGKGLFTTNNLTISDITIVDNEPSLVIFDTTIVPIEFIVVSIGNENRGSMVKRHTFSADGHSETILYLSDDYNGFGVQFTDKGGNGNYAMMPSSYAGDFAIQNWASLRTMLADANTNQTADRECISTNICKLIAPHIEPVKVLLNIYDNALEANWAFSIVNGDMKYACTTNEDITAFQKANPVLTDKQTADDYRVIVTGGEMKFFTDQQ